MIESNVIVSKFSIILAALVALNSSDAHAIPPCSSSHCAGVSAAYNKDCIELGMAGKPMLVIRPEGNCTCMCSCVAFGTQISTPAGDVKIEDLSIGDEISQVYNKNSSASISHRMRSTLESPHPVHELHYAGRSIIVSSNHPFITPDFKIVAADQLMIGDSVLSESGVAVKIKSNEVKRDFVGDLYNVIINPTSEFPDDHVILTNGIQSGDFLIQATMDSIQYEIDLRLGKIILIQQ